MRGKPPAHPQTVRDLRHANRAVLLGVLKARGHASRARLATDARLRLPTVVDLVADLISEGVVEEVGNGPSSGGRRPVLLALRTDAYAAVGVSVGSETVSGVVTNLNGQVGRTVREPSAIGHGRGPLRAQVHRVTRRLAAESARFSRNLLGVGVALPSPSINSRGGAFDLSRMGLGDPIHPVDLVPEDLHVPVVADNFANALAVGEYLYGAGQGARHLLCIVLQRGVGGAVVVNGRLHRGADGTAGEVGHLLVDPAGPRCWCGRLGCLAAFVGHEAIERRARELMRLTGRSTMGGYDLERTTAVRVVDAALRGDAVGAQVMREVGRYVGVAAANLALLMDPDVVVVGGPTMRAADLILPAAQHVLDHRRVRPAPVPIRASALADDASAVGAAALVLQDLFAAPAPDAAPAGRGGRRATAAIEAC